MFDDKMLRDFSREHGSLLAALPKLPPLPPSPPLSTSDKDYRPPLNLIQTSGGKSSPFSHAPSPCKWGWGRGEGMGGLLVLGR